VKDLGVLEGPVLVFGGAYSNLQALESMLAEVKRLGIPASNVIHTGDVVAYCAQPRETSELLKASGVECLMGNCEESIGQGALDCGCGFPEDSKCEEYSVNWYAHVTEEIKNDAHLKTWMGELPRRIEFEVGGKRMAVVHGSPRRIAEFVWASMSDQEFNDLMKPLPKHIDGVIGGHSGIPFTRFVPSPEGKERMWLNAGVIGMPANDSTKRGWYAILTPEASGNVEVSIKALDYDADGAAAAIFARENLVRGYADALTSGIWPSHDVLPVQEQMETGIPLDEKKVVWKKGKSAPSAASSSSTSCTALVLVAVAAATLTMMWAARAKRT